MDVSKIPGVALFNKPTVQVFLAGIIVGLSIGMLILLTQTDTYSFYYYNHQHTSINYFDFVGDHSENDTHHKMLDTSMADELFQKVRVLCWVMTGPANHIKKAIHVKSTWGKRCNKLLFMSTEEDPLLPSVALPVVEDRPNLWAKTKEALRYVYKHYHGQYDWFFKADDDTYTVMENLRYLLYYKNASDPVYYGCRMKLPQQSIDFMSGGAGYVLSKEALRRFIEEALPNKTICRHQNRGDEDVEIAKCLQNVGVKLGNSLDDENRNRFTPVFVNEMLIPGTLNDVKWYTEMMYNPYKLGFKCCSDNLITTHYVSPQQMYLLEYLIYHVTPFGRAYHPVLEQNSKRNSKDYDRLATTEHTLEWEDFD